MKTALKSDLKKWTYPDNYMGEDYSEYYMGPGQSRDSDVLERCNFAVALDMLGGESEKVIAARASHWACGWVEQILVHESAKAKLKILSEIRRKLESYPVLDETEFSEMEHEEALETIKFYFDDFQEELMKFLGLESLKKFPKKHVKEFLDDVYFDDVGYRGQEGAFVTKEALSRFNREYSNLSYLIERKNKVAIAFKKKCEASSGDRHA